MTGPLVIGTRGSALALAQADLVASALAERGIATTVRTFRTEGDASSAPLASLGGAGVFATAVREALVAGECDLAVHSLKDLPTGDYPGVVIAAVPGRGDARDALCSVGSATLGELPRGATVGTGSPRRRAQLLAARPDLAVVDLRGNVDTRLGRVAPGDLDAIVVAAVALDRLGRAEEASERWPLGDVPTAPGQGALAVETRVGVDDDAVRRAVGLIDDAPSRATVTAERALLAALEAGCSAPVGASAWIQDGAAHLVAHAYSADGSRRLAAAGTADVGERLDGAGKLRELGERLAAELLDAGAADLGWGAR